MRWREVFVGALAALIVTILGGLVVWYMTKAPQTPSEELEYNVARIASIKADQNTLDFISIKVANLGGKAAHDVQLNLSIPEGVQVIQQQVVSSAGPIANTPVIPKAQQQATLAFPVIAPSEVVNLTVLLQSYGSVMPMVSVRSAETIGKLGNAIPRGAEGLPGSVAFSIIPIALVAQLAMFYIFTKYLPLTPSLLRGSANNIAFVMLHNGLIEEGGAILTNVVSRKGGEAYELTNLGLFKGLSGDLETAEKYFVAAQRWSDAAPRWRGSRCLDATIKFNRCVVLLGAGRKQEAQECLDEAFNLHQQQVAFYCKLSTYIRLAAKEEQGTRQIVDRHSKS